MECLNEMEIICVCTLSSTSIVGFMSTQISGIVSYKTFGISVDPVHNKKTKKNEMIYNAK